MKNLAIPQQLKIEGNTYSLAIDTIGKNEMFVLTYEYDPMRENLFLIATYGSSIQVAVNKMQKLLKRESIQI